jgi:hypothetical protein
MLLKQETLRGVESGSISLAFRRWRRPTVKAGGTLLTPIGQLAIEAVDVLGLDEITESEATAAGFPDLASLRSRLQQGEDGDVCRVRLSLAGPDPRVALREEIPDGTQLELILQRLGRFDSRSASGPWTCSVLELIGERPGERAADLATHLGMDPAKFKANVRKLKGLGLTESLAVGYRLSPRGDAILSRLGDGHDGSG